MGGISAASHEDRVPKRAAVCRRVAARRGSSRGIDANGGGVQRPAHAGRADDRWCAAPTPSSSPRPKRRHRARRSHVRRARRASHPRVRARRRRRAAFCERGVVGFSCDDLTRTRRGERGIICAPRRCLCSVGVRSVEIEFRERG